MKKILTYIIVITVSVVVGIGIGMFNLKRRLLKGDNIQSDTTTVVVYDTTRITEPFSELAIQVKIKRFATVPTLLTISDTIKVPYYVKDTLMIPIEQRYYTGESYKAWVSGYLPKLDSIIVYNTTHTQTITNTQGKGARNEIYVNAGLNYYTLPAMSLELQAGYTRDRMTYYVGAGAITGDALKIYGMVGIKYTLFTKKW